MLKLFYRMDIEGYRFPTRNAQKLYEAFRLWEHGEAHNCQMPSARPLVWPFAIRVAAVTNTRPEAQGDKNSWLFSIATIEPICHPVMLVRLQAIARCLFRLVLKCRLG